jgi:hypothetical protein
MMLCTPTSAPPDSGLPSMSSNTRWARAIESLLSRFGTRAS